MLPVADLAPDPGNIRRDLGDLDGLRATIRARGVLQPLEVAWAGDDGWVVVFGHRRLAAAAAEGLTEVPCIEGPARDPADRVATQLTENLARKALTVFEEADAYRRLTETGRTQRQIAAEFGVSQSHISKRVAVTRLPDDITAEASIELADGTLTVDDIVELARLNRHPSSLKQVWRERAWRRLGDAARNEIAAIEQARRAAAVRARLEADGATIVEGNWLADGFTRARPGDKPDAYGIDRAGEPVALRRHVDPATTPGGLGLDVDDAWEDDPAQAEKIRTARERDQLAEFCMDRRRHIADHLATARTAKGAALDQLTAAVVERAVADSAENMLEAAVELLGGKLDDIDEGDDWSMALGAWLAARDTVKVAQALTFAAGESEHAMVRGYHVNPWPTDRPLVTGHYERLAAIGWQRTDLEDRHILGDSDSDSDSDGGGEE